MALDRIVGSMPSAFRLAERQREDLEEGVLVFVPGASDSRISNVRKTIAWLQTQQIPTECIVYKYQNLSIPDDELSPCTVIDNHGHFWMDHILQVPLNRTKKKYVLHVMDGIEVRSVDLARMTKAMADNDLVHTSPALYGKIWYPQLKPHLGFGRKVNYIEYHMDLFTRDNFACLQDLASQGTVNHWGWYVAEMMLFACPGNMGVIDAMKMFKFASGKYDHTEAYDNGVSWLKERGWDVGALTDHLIKISALPEEPLKGDLLPGDPQCDGSDACICEGGRGGSDQGKGGAGTDFCWRQ